MENMTGSKLARDTKENKRLSNIAFYFDELKKLRKLMFENQDDPEEVLDLLYESRVLPISLLEDLDVDLLTAATFFIFDGKLTPDFVESFRRTESRKFWE